MPAPWLTTFTLEVDALGEPRTEPDFEAAAAELGIPAEELEIALADSGAGATGRRLIRSEAGWRDVADGGVR